MSTALLPGQVEADAKIRHELDRILSGETFRNVDRLRGFLSFVVEEAVAGRGDRLKEYLVGIEVFGKDDTFDPRTDPIVRVQARRLRTRLASYYREEGQDDEITIELPKGGYTPIFLERSNNAMLRRSVTATLVSHNTVVVLPFEDYSPARDLDYLCKGLSQEIIHSLSKIDTVRVVAWDLPLSVGSGSTFRDAADRLHASTVISGSVRLFGDDLRITTQIIDAISGSYLWSESTDRKSKNLIRAQKEVARSVAKRFESGRFVAERKSRGRVHENLTASNFTLRGRHHLNQRTETGLHKAVELFERALTEDPNCASAHSGLADAYGLLSHYGVIPPAEAWSKAASHAASAVVLDDALAESHSTLAHLKSTQEWDWKGAEREFQRAIKLDPQYPTVRHWYAMSCLAPQSRLDEALEQMVLAQALDPISLIIARDVTMVYLYRREFETALSQHEQTVDLDPHFALSYWALGLVHEQQEAFDKSIAAFEKAIELAPESPRMHAALARGYALSGRRRKALRLRDNLLQLATERYVSPFEISCVCFALGERDAGFEWLSKACDDRCFDVINIKVDPRFDSLRADPRLREAVNRLGLQP